MQSPNKVLFLTLRIFSATGGIEKVCRVAGKALYEIEGENVSVFSLYDSGTDIMDKYFPARVFSGFSRRKASFIFSSIRKGFGKDVVILSHVNLLLVGFLIKVFSPRTKLVLIAHGIEVWGKTSFFRKIFLHFYDRVLSVSDYTRGILLAQNKMLTDQKVTIFNNCLDPFLKEATDVNMNNAIRNRYGFNEDNKVILTLTRISSKEKYKGYDHVLNAVSQLLPEYPNLRYLIIGKYDAVEKERMDAIIRKLGIEDYVIFAGFIPDEEIPAHFSLADLYVMPSKKEGFGIVFIEAMFYGLPVIAGNKDGSVDALAGGKLGLLVDPDNEVAITNAINDMLKHKGRHIPDRDILMQKFSFEVYRNNLKNIISSLR